MTEELLKGAELELKLGVIQLKESTRGLLHIKTGEEPKQIMRIHRHLEAIEDVKDYWKDTMEHLHSRLDKQACLDSEVKEPYEGGSEL